MGSADDLSRLRAYMHCLHVGIRVWAPLQLSLVREPSDVSIPRADCREVCVLFACAECLIWISLNFTGQPRTVQEYVGVGVQSLAYLGFRPADGLSVELEGWTTLCRIASVGHSLIRCTPHWRSVRCIATEVHPCREE